MESRTNEACFSVIDGDLRATCQCGNDSINSVTRNKSMDWGERFNLLSLCIISTGFLDFAAFHKPLSKIMLIEPTGQFQACQRKNKRPFYLAVAAICRFAVRTP
jgi:hypothetical protein